METKLKVQNCYSWLKTDNEKLKEKLWRALRFRRKNYFHTSLYKRGVWDGYDEFFKQHTGRFLTGLLPEVEYALDHLKVPYKLIDQRGNVQFRFKNIDKTFLTQWRPEGHDLKEMHDYQVDLVNQLIKHKRGVIQSPTASGKTFVMIGILKSLPQDCPTLILANKKSLVKQNYDEMQMWGFENVGRLYDKHNEIDTFTCATVQSLHKFPDIENIRALVVDEIHDMLSKVPKKYYNKLKSCSVRAAVSATPFKFGGSDKSQKYSVKGYFGPILATDAGDEKGRLTTKKLQERKILATADCFFYPITTPKIPYEIYLDAVTLGIAENWHFHQVVKRLCEKKLRGRTLIVVERIAHGDVLEEIIPGALWVRGEDTLETREKIINQLKYAKDDTVAIATQGIFNTGINVKIHNLVNAAGGQAEHQIIQRLGRGLRKANDKDKLNYYDFIFKINDYLEQHSNKRIKILKKEGHSVTVYEQVNF